MKKFFKWCVPLLCLMLAGALLGYGIYKIPSGFSYYAGEEVPHGFYYTLDGDTSALANQTVSTYRAKVKLFGFLPIKDATVKRISQKQLIPLGTPFGVKLYTKGVIVVDVEEDAPAPQAGLEVGDVILSYNGVEITSNKELKEQVNAFQGQAQKVVFQRNQRTRTVWVTPEKTENGYGIGLWVRDSAAGLGTLTYYDPQTKTVAGLGHSISDSDTGKTMPLGTGTMVEATVTGVKPGEEGDPGELLGKLKNEELGNVTQNCATGLFGTATAPFTGTAYPIALKNEVKAGKAMILCTVKGDLPKLYTISIVKVNNNLSEIKNLCIEITDADLLAETNGIVQGMSGSPILQNGKFIGAVTHVLVDDPTRGYGIFIENMLASAE